MDISLYVLLTTAFLPVFAAGLDGTPPPNTDITGEGGPPSCATTTCPENSVCNDDFGFVSCDCKGGMTGVNCDLVDPCVKNTTNCPDGMTCFADCPPNIVCEGFSGNARCRGCVIGWTGPYCEDDANECEYEDPKVCLNGGVCVNTLGSYRCNCQPEWTGSDCSCKRGTQCDPQESTDPRGAATQISSTLIPSFIVLLVSLNLSL